jgi:hypothetical protein
MKLDHRGLGVEDVSRPFSAPNNRLQPPRLRIDSIRSLYLLTGLTCITLRVRRMIPQAQTAGAIRSLRVSMFHVMADKDWCER